MFTRTVFSGCIVVATLAATLASCAAPPSAITAATAQVIVTALAGAWDNRRQFDAAPAALKVPPSVAGDWLDLQHAVFTAVDAPAIGERVLYLEWRSGGPDGAISRQRIWSFRTDAAGVVRMDFYAFVDGKAWAGKAAQKDAFRDLTTAALRGYGDACALRFGATEFGATGFSATGGGEARGVVGAGSASAASPSFVGVIRASECTITAASGRRMGIEAVVTLQADGVLTYRESGQLEDGRFAFRVPPTEPYRFERAVAAKNPMR